MLCLIVLKEIDEMFFLSNVSMIDNNMYSYLDESSSGRKGFTKNVAARNPIPITECTAIVNGLDLIGPIV
jgi:hypothetical protein